jgi:hypothetical protein
MGDQAKTDKKITKIGKKCLTTPFYDVIKHLIFSFVQGKTEVQAQLSSKILGKGGGEKT